jgi:hypothetical protein
MLITRNLAQPLKAMKLYASLLIRQSGYGVLDYLYAYIIHMDYARNAVSGQRIVVKGYES